MKALLLGALLVAGLTTGATAQQAVGPVAITNTVNGIPVTVSATSWVTTNSVGNELRVHARIFADLIDLQKKFASVVGSFQTNAATVAVTRIQLSLLRVARFGRLTIASS
jgi:hypothetical protein